MTMVENINYLVNEGIALNEANHIVKQMKRDFRTLPIDTDYETLEKTYLRLSVSIAYNRKQIEINDSITEVKKERKNLQYYDNRFKSVIVEYKE